MRIRNQPNDASLAAFLLGDVNATLIAAGIAMHYEIGTEIVVADSSSIGTLKTLTLELTNQFVAHGLDVDMHSVADAALDLPASAASHPAEPANLAECQSILNELKADYNTHIANLTPHRTKGALSGGLAARTAITIADATNQATGDALANELKAAFNRHVLQGVSTIVVD